MTISIELNRLLKLVENYLTREGLDVFHVERGEEGSEPYFYVGGEVKELSSHEDFADFVNEQPSSAEVWNEFDVADFVDTDEERYESVAEELMAGNAAPVNLSQVLADVLADASNVDESPS